MTIDNAHFKVKLEAEKTKLLEELGHVGRINPDDTNDWEPVAADLNGETAEAEERAGEISSFEDRSAIEFQLELRLKAITSALERCEGGTYGHCSVCSSPIEPARLEANPSALTCKAHME